MKRIYLFFIFILSLVYSIPIAAQQVCDCINPTNNERFQVDCNENDCNTCCKTQNGTPYTGEGNLTNAEKFCSTDKGEQRQFPSITGVSTSLTRIEITANNPYFGLNLQYSLNRQNWQSNNVFTSTSNNPFPIQNLRVYTRYADGSCEISYTHQGVVQSNNKGEKTENETEKKPSLIGMEQEGLHTFDTIVSDSLARLKANQAKTEDSEDNIVGRIRRGRSKNLIVGIPIDTAILIKWPPKKNGQLTIAGFTTGTFANNTFIPNQTNIKLGSVDVNAKYGDILIDDVPIPFERVSGGGNPGGGIPIDTAIMIKWPPIKSGKGYTTVSGSVTGYVQNGYFVLVQQSKNAVPTVMGKLGDILINDVLIPDERRAPGTEPEKPKGCCCVEEPSPNQFTMVNIDCPGGDCVKCCADVKKEGGKSMQAPADIVAAIKDGKNSGVINGKKYYFSGSQAGKETGLTEIESTWDKNKYPYGIVVFNNSSYGYDKAENIQEWMKDSKNLKGKGEMTVPVFIIPITLKDSFPTIQAANGAGTRAAVPSARGRPGLRREVVIPPPTNTPFFPEIGYGENIRLVKCTDKDGNEYFVNCPEGTEYCCDLAPLPQIDLTTPAENNGNPGGGITFDTAIMIKWPPKKNGQLSVAGVTTGTFTNNVFVPNQTNIKLGSVDVNAKYGDILIDDVPIPFERVSGGGNPGGGIPIDTAIMIKWPPVKSGNRFSTVSGSVTGYVQNGYFVLVQQSKNAAPTVMGKLGDILINDVLIPDERRAPGTEPEKPKGCCCVEEPSPNQFTMVNIDCPGGDCVKCCADVKKEGGKKAEPASLAMVSAIKEGKNAGVIDGKNYYFHQEVKTLGDLVSYQKGAEPTQDTIQAKPSLIGLEQEGIHTSTYNGKQNNQKPKQETTTLGEISALWDKNKFPYGIVVFNNSSYGYDKAENIQEWMKDSKNLKGKGELTVPVFIIPITLKDSFPTIQAANGAGTRAAVPSARGKPGLRREVIIPPPNNTPFFPEINYGDNVRLVKCTDKDGNEYYVNCPIDEGDCCNLAPLPFIDLTSSEKQMSSGNGESQPDSTMSFKWPDDFNNSAYKDLKFEPNAILIGNDGKKYSLNFKVYGDNRFIVFKDISTDFVMTNMPSGTIFLTPFNSAYSEPVKPGIFVTAPQGSVKANGAGTRIASTQASAKPGLKRLTPPPAPIGAAIPLGEVLFKNNGGGIKIDTAIVIYWLPVNGKDDYRQAAPPEGSTIFYPEASIAAIQKASSGTLLHYTQTSMTNLGSDKDDMFTTVYKYGDILIDDVPIPFEWRQNPSKIPSSDTAIIIKWPEDFKKPEYSEASFQALVTFIAANGSIYFIDLDSDNDGICDILETASKIPPGTMLLKRRPAKETAKPAVTDNKDKSEFWDIEKFPYGIVVFNNSSYGYNKAENVQEWMKDKNNLIGKGEMPVPVFIIPTAPNDSLKLRPPHAAFNKKRREQGFGKKNAGLIPPPNNTPFFPEIVYGENIRLVKCTDKDGNEYYVNCPEGTEYCCDLAPLPQIDLTTPAENNSSAGSGTSNEIRVWNAVRTSKQKSANNGNTSFKATEFPPNDKPITFSGVELHGDLGLKTDAGGNTFNPVIIFQFKDAKSNQVINELAFDYDITWSKQKWVDAFKKGGNTVPEGEDLFTELIELINGSELVKNGSTNFSILLSGDNSRTEIIAVPYFLENDVLLFFANETGFTLTAQEIQKNGTLEELEKNGKLPARDRIIARRRRGQ